MARVHQALLLRVLVRTCSTADFVSGWWISALAKFALEREVGLGELQSADHAVVKLGSVRVLVRIVVCVECCLRH